MLGDRSVEMNIEMMQSWADPAVRRRIRENPKQYAIDNEVIAADADVEVKMRVNTRDTMYVPIMRMDDSQTLDTRDLQSLQAAGDGTASTVGTVSTASTISCMCSTAGSAGSLSTGGTGGTASP